eukprot:14510677-Ditylum_brightwellii.AAC.1
MTGGREPLIVEYDVGFEDTGRIRALSLVLHMDSGCTIDESESDLGVALMHSDHSYFISDFRAEGVLYKTNLPSNTSCRAPGSVQVCHAVSNILRCTNVNYLHRLKRLIQYSFGSRERAD